MDLLILWIVVWLIGAFIGQQRGRTAAGFWWAVFLGPIGWLIVLLGPNPKKAAAEAAQHAQEQKIENIQLQHLDELRALRETIAGRPPAPSIEEASYLVRLDGREVGPIGKGELLELYAAGRVTPSTEVAVDVQPRTFRPLSQEIPLVRAS